MKLVGIFLSHVGYSLSPLKPVGTHPLHLCGKPSWHMTGFLGQGMVTVPAQPRSPQPANLGSLQTRPTTSSLARDHRGKGCWKDKYKISFLKKEISLHMYFFLKLFFIDFREGRREKYPFVVLLIYAFIG